MQAQMSSHRFYFDPALNHYYVIMNTPGHSRMQLYFKKSSRYRLVFANFSILREIGDWVQRFYQYFGQWSERNQPSFSRYKLQI